ncbi:MAG: hypothetical protein R3B90_10055 [Planctomycetaceae bacterium]
MLEEIDSDTFASKSREFRDREAELKLEIDVADRGRHEIIDIAVKAFELSQSRREKWFDADYAAKTSNPRNRLFELLSRWRKSRHHNEKALRPVGQRASSDR